ncbi:hypothetical protein D3C71_259120 [compost metagenome]
MKSQIRDAVFETNSSSSHSVTVAAEEMRDFNLDKETIREGVLKAQVFPDGYGWQWIRFYKPENVLAYLLYQAMPMEMRRDDPAVGVDLAEKVKESPRARHIIETVEKATGLRVEYVFPEVEGSHFYVDHESGGNGMEFASAGREDELLRLIFGRNSYIEMGNDNSQAGEYIQSDIGDILSCQEKMLDEPIDGEASFEADFSLGWGETESELVDADGVSHKGVLSMGWMHSILHDLRGVTLTDVHVAYAPDRFGSLGRMRGAVADQARETFFRWLNGKNKVEEYRDYGDEGPTDIRLLRDFKFGYTEIVTERGRGDYDDRTRITLKGVGSRALICKLASDFDDLLVQSEEYRSREKNRP